MRWAFTGERKRGLTLDSQVGSVRSSDMPTMMRVTPM
jgi:hypothetical protein